MNSRRSLTQRLLCFGRGQHSNAALRGLNLAMSPAALRFDL